MMRLTRAVWRTCLVGVVLGGLLYPVPAAAGQATPDQAAAQARRAQHDRWMTELSNAGRWGPDDDRGTLNLLTDDTRRAALALGRRGVVVSLQRPIELRAKDAEVAVDGTPNGVAFHEIRFRTFPADDPRGNAGFTSDVQEISVHGGRVTHFDALCHESDQGVMFNGFELAEVVSADAGCRRLGIDRLAEGILTRGVLVDVSLVRTPDEDGQRPADRLDVERWEQLTGVTVAAGDAVFFFNPETGSTGFDDSVVPWLGERDVAVVAGPDREQHRLVLIALGAYVLDNPELSGLAATARDLQRWEFLLVVTPIPTPGGTGSSINPLAVF